MLQSIYLTFVDGRRPKSLPATGGGEPEGEVAPVVTQQPQPQGNIYDVRCLGGVVLPPGGAALTRGWTQGHLIRGVHLRHAGRPGAMLTSDAPGSIPTGHTGCAGRACGVPRRWRYEKRATRGQPFY